MARFEVRIGLLVAALLLVVPLALGCTDLQAVPGTETTVSDTVTTTVETTPTSVVVTTSPTVAATTTTHPPITTSTTLTGLHIDPGMLQTNPSLLRVDMNMLIDPTRYEDTHPFLHWEWEDVWTEQLGLGYSAGSQKKSNTLHSYVQIAFHGTGVQLVATTSANAGKLIAHLSGPGVARNETINLYSASTKYQQLVWYSGHLTAGDYAVYFEWDPANAPTKSTSIDAIDVWGTVTPP
jgi:hypothetical protein